MAIDTRLVSLIKEQAHGPCVSIIVPTARAVPEKLQNRVRLEQSVEKAQALLAEYPQAVVNAIASRLAEVIATYDATQTSSDGIAVVASRNMSLMWPIMGACSEVVTVGSVFALTDLVYHMQQPQSFWVLVLGKDRARVYKQDHGVTHEVVTPLQDAAGNPLQGFPLTAVEPTDHIIQGIAAGDRGADYLDHEVERFFRLVDSELAKLIATEHLPVVLCTLHEHQPMYMNVAHHPHLISAVVTGEYMLSGADKAVAAAGKSLAEAHVKQDQAILEEYREALGHKKQAAGIEYTWEAAHAGRVHLLLIERTLSGFGRINPENDAHLQQSPSRNAQAPDRISDIIAAEVLKHGGAIRVVETGSLQNKEGIGALLRY